MEVGGLGLALGRMSLSQPVEHTVPYQQGVPGATKTEMSQVSVTRRFSITEQRIRSPFTVTWLLACGAFRQRFAHLTSQQRDKSQRKAVEHAVHVWNEHAGAAVPRELTLNHTSWTEVKAMRRQVLPTIPGSVPLQVRPLDHEGLQMDIDDASNFKVYDTSDGDVLIRDGWGKMIGYLYRGPEELIDGLVGTADQLPKGHANALRGPMDQTHWAVWQGQGAKDLAFSANYLKHKEAADEFLKSNSRLIRHLSNDLELLCPDTALRYNKLQQRLNSNRDDELELLCGAFSSIAVNLRQSSKEGYKIHRDRNDVVTGYCMIVPFSGTGWTGGDLIIWQAGIRLALRHGDVLVLNTANWIHSSAALESGVRNAVIFFSHESCWTKSASKKPVGRGFVARKIAEKREKDRLRREQQQSQCP